MHFHRVAGQFYNRPLLLLASTAEVVSNYLFARIQNVAPPAPSARLEQAGMISGTDYRPVPYRFHAGTAVISIAGELINRGYWMNADSGLVSYEGIRNQLLAAANDPRVRNVMLDIESPGGEALGAMETAMVVREVNKTKPVVALVNGMAASGAYAIASAARSIVTIPSGITGSIGTVMVHFDFSEFLRLEGVKPTLIAEPIDGEKTDGNPYEPLSDEVAERLRAATRYYYDLFVASVALDKRLTPAAARANKAAIYVGRQAVETKLADDVGTFEEVLEELSA